MRVRFPPSVLRLGSRGRIAGRVCRSAGGAIGSPNFSIRPTADLIVNHFMSRSLCTSSRRSSIEAAAPPAAVAY